MDQGRDLFELLDDTPEQALSNSLKHFHHDPDLADAESIHHSACDELHADEKQLQDLDVQGFEDPGISAQREAVIL